MTALTARLRCHPGCSQLSSWKGRSEVPWTYDHNSCHGKRPWVAFQASSHGSSASAAQEKCPTLPLPSNPLSLSLPSFSTFNICIYIFSLSIRSPSPLKFPSQIATEWTKNTSGSCDQTQTEQDVDLMRLPWKQESFCQAKGYVCARERKRAGDHVERRWRCWLHGDSRESQESP